MELIELKEIWEKCTGKKFPKLNESDIKIMMSSFMIIEKSGVIKVNDIKSILKATISLLKYEDLYKTQRHRQTITEALS